MRSYKLLILVILTSIICYACSAENPEPTSQNVVVETSDYNKSVSIVHDKVILFPEKDRASALTDSAAIMEESEDKEVYLVGFIYYNKSENKFHSMRISKIDKNTAEHVAFNSASMPPDEFFHTILACVKDYPSAQGKVLCVLRTISQAMKDCARTNSPEDCWMF